MSKNVGMPDKLIRVALAIVLSVIGFIKGGNLGILLYAIAIILLITAIIGFCAIYTILGINTCRIKGPQ